MASITINEISRNYSFAVPTSTYATIALPITACWGPGYFDPDTLISQCHEIDTKTDWDVENHSDMLDRTAWQRFPASQAGLEAYVSTFRGPVANYRLCNDYSYQMGLTLLNAGYDILVCRISPGAKSGVTFVFKDINGRVDTSKTVNVRAKYAGSFGNKIQVEFKNIGFMSSTSSGNIWSYYWNMIVYIVDDGGTKRSVENKTFVWDIDNSTDSIPHWREIESEFVDLSVTGEIPDYTEDSEGKTSRVFLVDADDTRHSYAILTDGTDLGEIPNTPNDLTGKTGDELVRLQKLNLLADAKKWVDFRYRWNGTTSEDINTGFEYASLERNYPLVFDYMMGNTDFVVETVETYFGLDPSDPDYAKKHAKIVEMVGSFSLDTIDLAKIEAIRFREWIFTHLVGINGRDGYEGVYDLLKDKLAYNPNRIISPGWDDQDFLYILGADDTAYLCSNVWGIRATSPIHRKLMDVAYYSRCATGMLDIPRSLDKKFVYDETSEDFFSWGYAQKLARYNPTNTSFSADVQLYHTHSALFTCWGRYTYTTLTRPQMAPPAFLAILIQRAMILNQAVQYEWLLPTDRSNNLRITKLDYDIPQKLLNIWQKPEGVGVNCITPIPGQNVTVWGNSTLFEVPPATYQALSGLSTRYLVNAVEDIIYKVGVSITFQYSNGEAYASFRAGLDPILDTMKNAGAIEDAYVKMSMDINEFDQVNARSVIGQVYLVVSGVIETITCDLIALPPNTNLDQYRQ